MCLPIIQKNLEEAKEAAYTKVFLARDEYDNAMKRKSIERRVQHRSFKI